jgi:hypothetical protein
MFGIATISLLLVSNSVGTSAQTNFTNAIGDSNVSNSTLNSTSVTNSTSTNSDNPIVQSIDAAIKAIKDGDKDSGKKLLLKAEEALEGKSDLVDAEKRIEASLAALKDGDDNGAISQADEAKRNILEIYF